MLFAIYYEMTPERRDEVLKRFQKFGDAAPKGMKVVGNWLSVTLLEGWSIVEANDIADLGKLFQSWTDLNVNHITPVFDEDSAHSIPRPTRSNRRAAEPPTATTEGRDAASSGCRSIRNLHERGDTRDTIRRAPRRPPRATYAGDSR